MSKSSKLKSNSTSHALDANQLRSRHLYNLIHATSTSPLNKLYSLQFDKVNNINGITTGTTTTTTNNNTPKTPQSSNSSLLSHKICNACGVLLIPGLNVSIRIKYGNGKNKKNKKGKKSKGTISDEGKAEGVSDRRQVTSNRYTRKLRFKCLGCGDKTYESLLDGSEKQQQLQKHSNTAAEPSSSTDTVKDPPLAQEPNSKLESTSVSTSTATSTPTDAALLPQPTSEQSPQANNKNKSAKQRAKKRKAELNLLTSLKQRKTTQSSSPASSSKLDSLNLSDFLK